MRLDPNQRADLSRYLALAQVGMEIVAPAGLGVAADLYFGWLPWATCAGTVLGFAGGLTHLVRLSNRAGDPTDPQAPGARRTVSGKLLFLAWGVAAFWAAVALPARYLVGGDATLLYSATGAVLCVVPAALTLAWAARTFRHDPSMAVLAALGGTGVRVFAVLGAAVLLGLAVPAYRETEFWVWLVIFYLFTLALETALLLAGRGTGRGPGRVG